MTVLERKFVSGNADGIYCSPGIYFPQRAPAPLPPKSRPQLSPEKGAELLVQLSAGISRVRLFERGEYRTLQEHDRSSLQILDGFPVRRTGTDMRRAIPDIVEGVLERYGRVPPSHRAKPIAPPRPLLPIGSRLD